MYETWVKQAVQKFVTPNRRFRRFQSFSETIIKIWGFDLVIFWVIFFIAADVFFAICQSYQYAKDTVQALEKTISRKNTTDKFWVD